MASFKVENGFTNLPLNVTLKISLAFANSTMVSDLGKWSFIVTLYSLFNKKFYKETKYCNKKSFRFHPMLHQYVLLWNYLAQ